MNTDVEDLLRQGMARFTADLRAPAGLTRRAARRRRRRLALRSAAGAAAALTAGAVAVAAVVVPGARSGADASAYVVKRVDRALSTAEPGEIAQVTVTTRTVTMPGGTTATTTAEEWSYGGQWRSIVNSPAGRPAYDEGSTTATLDTLVDYQTRTWARQHERGHPRTQVRSKRDCRAAPPLLFPPGLPGKPGLHASSSATVVRALRISISCKTLAVAGRQRVDGIEAIKLTSPPDEPSQTIWVSPGTYLPVRVVLRSTPHHGVFLDEQLVQKMTADITWLPPTARNRAKLTVPIPAGFRRVPFARAVRPILRLISGGLPNGVSRLGPHARPRVITP